MAITITWSLTNGGAAVAEPVNQGSGAAGSILTAVRLYLRHNGENSLSNCKLYLGEKSGSYTGAATAAKDKAEMLAWGDTVVANDFGGVQFNFDQAGGFPAAQWGTNLDKDKTYGKTIRTGHGDTKENAVILPTVSGATAAGVIPAGGTPGVSFQMRIKIPTSESTAGKREVDLKLRYTYTS